MNFIPIAATTDRGLPLFTADSPGVFTGSLVFGVGRRDESARTAGVAHLVEHLVMQRVGRVHLIHNAVTTDQAIYFHAQGDPAQVAEFLNRVSQAVATLNEITADDVVAQRRVIMREMGEDDEQSGGGPLLERFGATDLGLMDFGAPAHRSLTTADVLAFSDLWMHAANAAVTLSGPVPDNLDVLLPERPNWVRPGSRPSEDALTACGWNAGTHFPLALSMVLRSADPAALSLVAHLFREALHTGLRTERHLVYDVDAFVGDLSPEERVVAFSLDPDRSEVFATATATMSILRGIADEGPSPEIMAAVEGEWLAALSDPTTRIGELPDLAASVLRGNRTVDELDPPDIRAVPSRERDRVLREALGTVMLTLHVGADIEPIVDISAELTLPEKPRTLGYYEQLSAFQFLKASLGKTLLLSPKPFRGLRGQQLAIDAQRIALLVPGIGYNEVAFEDVLMAGTDPTTGLWDLTTSSGGGLVLLASDWRGGSRITAALTRVIPPELIYRISTK